MGGSRRAFGRLLGLLPLAALLRPGAAPAQSSAPPYAAPAGQLMLTIFLRHDESKTVDEINRHLRATGWYEKFPPAGAEIIGWYVMMGIGQVVILRFAAERLREVNRVVESAAWGGYRTEFYPTYDYRALWEQAKQAAGTP